ncbi:MAG: type II toxin-antitoxin system CcdA family antitoxin [bacterium]
MALTKTSITVSDGIFQEAKKYSSNFSALAADALKEYMRRKHVEKAVSSFGKWASRDEDSVNIVNKLRNNFIFN